MADGGRAADSSEVFCRLSWVRRACDAPSHSLSQKHHGIEKSERYFGTCAGQEPPGSCSRHSQPQGKWGKPADQLSHSVTIYHTWLCCTSLIMPGNIYIPEIMTVPVVCASLCTELGIFSDVLYCMFTSHCLWIFNSLSTILFAWIAKSYKYSWLLWRLLLFYPDHCGGLLEC